MYTFRHVSLYHVGKSLEHQDFNLIVSQFLEQLLNKLPILWGYCLSKQGDGPIVKKLGLYLNLANKDDHKPLGILKLLRFAKVKRDSIK